MRTLRLIFNILLGIGCFLVFNDSETFIPNLVGLACFALLIIINPKGDAWLRSNEK